VFLHLRPVVDNASNQTTVLVHPLRPSATIRLSQISNFDITNQETVDHGGHPQKKGN
jgi:hypothetical protein